MSWERKPLTHEHFCAELSLYNDRHFSEIRVGIDTGEWIASGEKYDGFYLEDIRFCPYCGKYLLEDKEDINA